MTDHTRGAEKIQAGLYLVGGPDLTDPTDCLVYAVDGGTEAALIDCGAGRSAGQIAANLTQALGGVPLTTLILTHGHVDHIGGLAEITVRFSPRVVCHRGDLEAIATGDPKRTAASWYGLTLPPIQPDHVIDGDDETLAVGAARLRCLHTPGHTPGSIAVVWDTPEGRVLFAQDVHGPFLPEFGSNRDRWAQSMERLLALHADILCEGHYGVFRPRAAAEEFILGQLEQQGYR